MLEVHWCMFGESIGIQGLEIWRFRDLEHCKCTSTYLEVVSVDLNVCDA